MAFTGNAACNSFKVGLPSGVFNLATGTSQVYKIALYTNNASLDATTAAYTASGEVLASGYTAGGYALVVSQAPTVGSTGGTTAYFSFDNAVWASALTARGALIYLDNGTTNPAVCVLDFGSDKTSTGTFTVQFPAATNASAIIRIK
jgi:hypothetical protein